MNYTSVGKGQANRRLVRKEADPEKKDYLGHPFWRWVDIGTEYGEVELLVDIDFLIKELGGRALQSKKGESILKGGGGKGESPEPQTGNEMIQEPNDPSGAYAAFFFTEDEAIDHCRKINRELKPGDSNCYAVIDGPGCGDDEDEHPQDCQCCAYAVVDLETAKEILDYPESGLPCLVVTD